MMRRWVWFLMVLLVASSAWGQYQFPPNRRYPSALVSVNAGSPWSAPTDPDTIDEFIAMYGAAGVPEVQQWVLSQADILTGSSFGANVNSQIGYVAYAYWHTIQEPADALRKWAVKNGVDDEDFSLHYSVDTIINTTTIGVTSTFWMGVIGAGSTDSANGYGVRLTDRRDVFVGVNNGGAFFVWGPLPFTDIHVTLQQPGVGGSGLVVEYPSAVDANDGFKVTQWSQATILEDTTNNFSQSGTIRIAFPPGWKYAALYPPHAFYDNYLAGKGGVFALRIKCFNFTQRPLVASVTTTPALEYLDGEPYVGVLHSGTAQAGGQNTITLATSASSSSDAYKSMLVKIVGGTGAGQVRVITAYAGSTRVATVDRNWDTVPDSTSEYKIVRRVVRIRGWDPANDRNGDGWVDDSEFANLANTTATARFRHQARLIYTNAWASSSAWNVANVHHTGYRQAVKEIEAAGWASIGAMGAYIDDAISNMLGSQWVSRHKAVAPAVLQGGFLSEYSGGRVDQDDPTNLWWMNGYNALINEVKTYTGSSWVGGNIANYNPFTNTWLRLLFDSMTWYLTEDSFRTGVAVDNYGGLFLHSAWVYPALASYGKKVLLFGHVHGITTSTNTRQTWERKLAELTAMYYLVQIPGMHYMRWWNSGYTYGNGLTSVSVNSFWKAGVPMNYAYIPRGLLSVDIGVPANTIPEGKRPMDLIRDTAQYGGNTKIGDTTSTTLTLYDGFGEISTVPTYIYILQQVDPRNRSGPQGALIPYDAVYARNYTKGIVLYRALEQYSGLWTGYEDSVATVQLPGTYRKVNYDGTLGPPVTEVQIRGFEGIIMVKDEDNPTTFLSVSTSAAPLENLKPGEVITVRVDAHNEGNQELRNVGVSPKFDNLPGGRIPPNFSYVPGSLTVNGVQHPDPQDTSTINVILSRIAPGETVVVEFRIVFKQ